MRKTLRDMALINERLFGTQFLCFPPFNLVLSGILKNENLRLEQNNQNNN